MKPTPVQEKIISLLHSSPELCDFLLASPEKLQTADYANIIAGAPISLWTKRELLGELEASLTDSGDAEFVHRYVTCLDAALQSMTRPAGETLIAAEFCGADNVGEYTDGPYYTHFWDAFAEILRTARAEDEDDWQIQYLRIKQYDLKAIGSFQWYGSEDYTFLADPHGEIQYFIHGQNADETPYGQAEAAFGRTSDKLSLPVPYQPGDILEIDCRPYAPGPVYCVIAEVGDDCCGVQCFYRCGIRCCNPEKMLRIEHGALKYGHYFSGYPSCSQFLSPLYRAKVYHGKLPRFSEFMEPLAEKLREDPGIAQKLYELEHYFTFS